MDAKLQEVLLDYGLEGYGLYWYCIELIASKVEVGNITYELEHDARIIARNTGSTPQKVEEMMKKFIKNGLFEASQGVITCLSLSKCTDEYINKSLRKIKKNNDFQQGELRIESGQTPDSVGINSGQNDINSGQCRDKVRTVSGQSPPRREGEEITGDEITLDQSNNNITGTVPSGVTQEPVTPLRCPHVEILKIWSEELSQLPQPQDWISTRPGYKNLARRWKGKLGKQGDERYFYHDKESGLAWWRRFFKFISRSDFLINRLRSFDLDWTCNAENFRKILQLKYHEKHEIKDPD